VAAVEKLRSTEVSLAEEVEKAPARLRARGRSRSGSWTRDKLRLVLTGCLSDILEKRLFRVGEAHYSD
jgi:hypothetical protein